MNDAFHKHDDYLTRKGHRSAKRSIVKRVTGTVLGFALQEAKRQRELAATDEPRLVTEERPASGDTTSEAGAGDASSAPLGAHCRIGKVIVRLKFPSRYRARQACDLMTTKLVAELRKAGK